LIFVKAPPLTGIFGDKTSTVVLKMVLLARIITHYTVFFQLFAEFVGSRVTIFRLHSQAEHLDAPPF
jgi:hypothetical protein